MHTEMPASETLRPSEQLQPVFDALLERSPRGGHWLRELWNLARRSRLDAALQPPDSLGKLTAADAPRDPAARMGTIYDRPVAPPAAFLQWLLEHPDAMHVGDASTFGAKNEDVRAWRRKLFSKVAVSVSEAQAEGLSQLGKRLAQRGRNKWWAFEGFLRVDCCFVTDECVLVLDGKCVDDPSPSTVWFPQRSRVWRHVEAANELAGGRPFGVILAVADEPAGSAALGAAAGSLDASFPHLGPDRRADLSRHLLGFVTVPDMITRFGLTPAV